MFFINQILHTVTFFPPDTLRVQENQYFTAARELSLTISVEKCHHKFATETG